MISNLLNVLHDIGLEMNAKEVAEVLWLASHIEQSIQLEKPTQLDDRALPREDNASSNPSLSDWKALSEQNNSKLTPPPISTQLPASSIHLPQEGFEGGDNGQRGLQFRSPAASALPGALDIARALRPLMRRVPSNTRRHLDENATAKQIAEAGLWLPVLRPVMERWLEVAVVVDEGASMIIWKRTILELRSLLEHQGAFRDIRIWGLVTDANNGNIQIHVGTDLTQDKRQLRNPRELLDSNGRRLIIVVSDCVSSAWHNGSISFLLNIWGSTNPVVIAQVLPQRLWVRTSLGTATHTRLRSLFPGTPNKRLAIFSSNSWTQEQHTVGIPMPVVTLEAKSLSGWARMLTCKDDAAVTGYIFETKTVLESMKSIEDSEPSDILLTSEERLYHFRTTASPLAQKLAQLLAAAPISLPIIRLIQQIMLPESRQVHIAEVFLGGLLEEIPSDKQILDPDDVQYEFVDGVRDLLLNSTSASDAMQVLKEVSDFIGEQIGRTYDFRAVLGGSTNTGDMRIDEQSRPFAAITIKVLHRLGGKYAVLADRLEHASVPPVVSVSQTELSVVPGHSKEEQKKAVPSKRRFGWLDNVTGRVGSKTICPRCFEEFYIGDCEIVAGLPFSEISEGTVLKAAPKGLERQIARLNPAPLTGPNYVRARAYRKCPNCEYQLPHNSGSATDVRIAVIGDVFSGKSHYLAALMNQLRQASALQVIGCNQIFGQSNTDERYFNEYYRPLFVNRQSLPATNIATGNQLEEPLIYELVFPKKSVNLLFYDISGQDIVGFERLVNYGRNILNASAIIFLADPMSMPEIVQVIPNHLKKLEFRHLRSDLVLNRVIQTFRQNLGISLSKPLKIPIAITVSKSDLLRFAVTDPYPPLYLKHNGLSNRLDIPQFDFISNEVQSLLQRMGEQLLLKSSASFENVSFFAVSATGWPTDQNGTYPTIEPMRILDPLLWTLWKLGIIRDD